MAAAHLVVRVQLRNVLDRTTLGALVLVVGGKRSVATARHCHILRYVAIGKHALGRYFAEMQPDNRPGSGAGNLTTSGGIPILSVSLPMVPCPLSPLPQVAQMSAFEVDD